MNILNKIVPFKMRRGLAALGVAGAMAGACKKVEPTQDTRPVEIELRFSSSQYLGAGEIQPDNIRRVLKEAGTDNVIIYLVPEYDWSDFMSTTISGMRRVTLEQAINTSPKVRGKGDFNFRVGEASKVPEDSLWYVKNGWTINKYLKDREKQK